MLYTKGCWTVGIGRRRSGGSGCQVLVQPHILAPRATAHMQFGGQRWTKGTRNVVVREVLHGNDSVGRRVARAERNVLLRRESSQARGGHILGHADVTIDAIPEEDDGHG